MSACAEPTLTSPVSVDTSSRPPFTLLRLTPPASLRHRTAPCSHLSHTRRAAHTGHRTHLQPAHVDPRPLHPLGACSANLDSAHGGSHRERNPRRERAADAGALLRHARREPQPPPHAPAVPSPRRAHADLWRLAFRARRIAVAGSGAPPSSSGLSRIPSMASHATGSDESSRGGCSCSTAVLSSASVGSCGPSPPDVSGRIRTASSDSTSIVPNCEPTATSIRRVLRARRSQPGARSCRSESIRVFFETPLFFARGEPAPLLAPGHSTRPAASQPVPLHNPPPSVPPPSPCRLPRSHVSPPLHNRRNSGRCRRGFRSRA